MKSAQDLVSEIDREGSYCGWIYDREELIRIFTKRDAEVRAQTLREAADAAWNQKVAQRFEYDYNWNMACQSCNKSILSLIDRKESE